MLRPDPEKMLPKDIMLCGKSGGKYNERYFFALDTDQGTMILDRTNLRVADMYVYEIEIINYSGLNIGRPAEEHIDLRETMMMLPTEKDEK